VGNWFNNSNSNIALPKEQWHEIEALFAQATSILEKYAEPFDNKTLPEHATRSSLQFFSNVIIKKEDND